MWRRGAIAAALSLCLAGCATKAEIAARNAAEDDAKCRSYGAKEGDPAYVQCRAQLDAARTQAEATAGAGGPGPAGPPKIVDGYHPAVSPIRAP